MRAWECARKNTAEICRKYEQKEQKSVRTGANESASGRNANNFDVILDKTLQRGVLKILFLDVYTRKALKKYEKMVVYKVRTALAGIWR